MALKIARPTLGRESFFASILASEITHLREAAHQNIIEIYQQGEVRLHENKYPFYIMEFVAGAKDTAEYFTDSPRKLDELLSVLSQAFSGLEHLHKIGVLHGDVKLENILVSSDGRALISDLGSARHISKGDTNTELVFTRPYAHPDLIKIAAPTDSDSNRARAPLTRDKLRFAFDMYALGQIFCDS